MMGTSRPRGLGFHRSSVVFVGVVLMGRAAADGKGKMVGCGDDGGGVEETSFAQVDTAGLGVLLDCEDVVAEGGKGVS